MVATALTVKLVSAAFLVIVVTVAIVVPLTTHRKDDKTDNALDTDTVPTAIPSPAPSSTTPLESLLPTDDNLVNVAPSVTPSPGNVFQHQTMVPTILNDNSDGQPNAQPSDSQEPTSTIPPTISPLPEVETTLVPTPTLLMSVEPMKTILPTVVLEPEQVEEPTVMPLQAPSPRPFTVSPSFRPTTSTPSITDWPSALTETPTNISPTPGTTAVPTPETFSSQLPVPAPQTLSPMTFPSPPPRNNDLPTSRPTSTRHTSVPIHNAPTTSPVMSLTADPSSGPTSLPSMAAIPSTSPSRLETMSPSLRPPSLSPESLLPTGSPTITRSTSSAPYPIPTDLFVGGGKDTVPLGWFQMGEAILGTSSESKDDLGASMAMNANGTIIAVGAPQLPGCAPKASPGYVQVRRWNAGTFQWEPLGGQLSGMYAEDEFGKTVALSSDGMVLAVGAPQTKREFGMGYGGGRGYVTIYRYNKESNTWEQFQRLVTHDANKKEFGSALVMSASGETIAVGCEFNSNRKMLVQVFRFDAAYGGFIRLGPRFQRKSPHLGMSASGFVVSMGSEDQDSTEIFQYDEVSGLWTLVGGNTVPGRAKALSGNGLVVATHKGLFQYLESKSQWEQLGDLLEQLGDLLEQLDDVSLSYDGLTMAHKASFQAFCRRITGPDADDFTDSPSTSPAPSTAPSSFSPTGSSAAPSAVPSVAPSHVPSTSPSLSVFPSESPTTAPTDSLYGTSKECEIAHLVRVMRYSSTSFQWERMGRDLRLFAKCLRSTVLSDDGLTFAVSGQPEVGNYNCNCARGSVYVITADQQSNSKS